MYDRILFPTDGSERANAAIDHILDFVEDMGATLHILNVADTTHDSVTRIGDEVLDVLEREGEQIVEETAQYAASRHVSPVTHVLQGGVSETIVSFAEEYDIDLIAMPTHGRAGLERLLLGSTTERVVRRASVPVLTLHPADDRIQYPYENVLVPTDGSECAMTALREGMDVVKSVDATLHVLSVVDVTSLGVDVHSKIQVDAIEERATETVTEATSIAADAGVESVVETIEHGDSVYRAIQSYVADYGIDLVVMGTHGRTGLDRYLLGSVTEKTVRTSTVPVLTVHEAGADIPDP